MRVGERERERGVKESERGEGDRRDREGEILRRNGEKGVGKEEHECNENKKREVFSITAGRRARKLKKEKKICRSLVTSEGKGEGVEG